MKYQGLDLNLLVVLHAVITEGNITRAGEKVFLSQPGISSAVTRLRDYFQDELFIPSARGLEMTPLCRSLAEPVREILESLETEIVAPPRYDPHQDQRCYRLLVSELTLILIMPAVVARAKAAAPGITLRVITQNESTFALLDRGEADLLIVPEGFAVGDHPRRTLYVERYTTVVWRDSKRFGTELTREQYLNAGHVAVRLGALQQPSFEEQWLVEHGINRRVEVITANMISPPSLVVGTDRIATVHEKLAHLAVQRLPLRELPLPIPAPTVTQVMQWHRRSKNDPALFWLMDIIAEEASRLYGRLEPA